MLISRRGQHARRGNIGELESTIGQREIELRKRRGENALARLRGRSIALQSLTEFSLAGLSSWILTEEGETQRVKVSRVA
jgi:hypothetical protein